MNIAEVDVGRLLDKIEWIARRGTYYNYPHVDYSETGWVFEKDELKIIFVEDSYESVRARVIYRKSVVLEISAPNYQIKKCVPEEWEEIFDSL